MAFVENLDVFFDDFKNEVIYDNSIYYGQLNEPDELVANDVVMTTEYELTAKTSDFINVVYDEDFLIDNVPFKVRNVRKIDDGLICIVTLSKQ